MYLYLTRYVQDIIIPRNHQFKKMRYFAFWFFGFFFFPKHKFKIQHVVHTYGTSQFRCYVFNSLSEM